jgi:hypothetical protein
MKQLFQLACRTLAVAFLSFVTQAQNQITTNWVEMLPENEIIEAFNSDGARKVYRAALPAYDSSMGTLVGVRVQIAANYGTTFQFGLNTPFRYSVEQLGNTPLAGYQGTYGSITYVSAAGEMCGGIGAWLGMCGGQPLSAFDGQVDGAGLSGHTTGNQIGEWAQEKIYGPSYIPSMYYGGINGSGLVPVAAMLTAQGFFSEWNAPGHYFKRFQTHTSLNGERALSLKVRFVYETL